MYIHRIVTYLDYSGQHLVQQIVEWAKDYIAQHQKEYIQLDTAGHNQKLIDYYTHLLRFSFFGYRSPY